METNPKKQRQHFYRDYACGQWSMSELCGRYQISRPTSYKWVDRIEAEGLKAERTRSQAWHAMMSDAELLVRSCTECIPSVLEERGRFAVTRDTHRTGN